MAVMIGTGADRRHRPIGSNLGPPGPILVISVGLRPGGSTGQLRRLRGPSPRILMVGAAESAPLAFTSHAWVSARESPRGERGALRGGARRGCAGARDPHARAA